MELSSNWNLTMTTLQSLIICIQWYDSFCMFLVINLAHYSDGGLLRAQIVFFMQTAVTQPLTPQHQYA